MVVCFANQADLAQSAFERAQTVVADIGAKGLLRWCNTGLARAQASFAQVQVTFRRLLVRGNLKHTPFWGSSWGVLCRLRKEGFVASDFGGLPKKRGGGTLGFPHWSIGPKRRFAPPQEKISKGGCRTKGHCKNAFGDARQAQRYVRVMCSGFFCVR